MSKILFSGMSWNLFSRIFSNGSQLLIYFVLARLLSPTDFGVIAIVLVFINISTIFANAGLGSAIIQNKVYDKDKFNTIYILSISFGIIISSILYVFSPFISSFFPSDADLVFLIRFTIPLIIFNSINSIQINYYMYYILVFGKRPSTTLRSQAIDKNEVFIVKRIILVIYEIHNMLL